VSVPGPETKFLRTSESWQNEVWGYYDNLGEYNYAVTWKSAMLSRVRLHVAVLEPGQDEPVRSDDPVAVDVLDRLSGGTSGQAQLMSSIGVHLDIPGEGYLIGETADGIERWTIRSVDEVRASHGRFEVVRDDTPSGSLEWRSLLPDAMVVRIYRPHKRWHFKADSPSRAARVTMRELELVNRHIISQYLSRLASAGVVVFPDEITFPVREEFADAPDPFVAEWVEIAATAIREPGSASAVVPIPIKVPGEYVDKIKHLDFTLALDDKIIEKRDSSIKRLATQVNIPAEVLLGMGDVNHWGAWQLEEGALKTTISPDAELICDALTKGYLQPRLAASGVEDPSRFVVWYDMSELTIRPDRSANAVLAYDRLELSGRALLRESGFDEKDRPEPDELLEQSLKLLLRTNPAAALTALSELTGTDLSSPAPDDVPDSSDRPEESVPDTERTAPDTQGVPPPPPDVAARDRTDRVIAQSKAPHAIRFGLNGRTEVLHPAVCERHAYSCPFTHASLKLKFKPGTAGVYVCTLDAFGLMRVGNQSPHLDPASFLSTGVGYANGLR
jgi:hypothetical protein